jgi:hypothetical protein
MEKQAKIIRMMSTHDTLDAISESSMAISRASYSFRCVLWKQSSRQIRCHSLIRQELIYQRCERVSRYRKKERSTFSLRGTPLDDHFPLRDLPMYLSSLLAGSCTPSLLNAKPQVGYVECMRQGSVIWIGMK